MVVINKYLMFIIIFILSLNILSAQIPDKFTNLTILSKDIGKKDLIDVMKNFTFSLGVRCNYCHAGKEGIEAPQELSEIDFASDKIPAKDITRVMMKMTGIVNNDFLTKISEESESVMINCETCHKAMPAPPKRLDYILFDEISKNGVEAAFKKYKDLRDKYYGDYVYNFAFKSISRLSNKLRETGKYDECLEFLNMYKVLNTDMWRIYFESGKTYHEKNDFKNAEKYYKMALELNKDNSDILWYLDKLKEENNKK